MNFDMSLSSQVIFEHIFSTLTTTQDIHGPVEKWANYPSQIKLPNLSNLSNDKLSKIEHHFRNKKYLNIDVIKSCQ